MKLGWLVIVLYVFSSAAFAENKAIPIVWGEDAVYVSAEIDYTVINPGFKNINANNENGLILSMFNELITLAGKSSKQDLSNMYYEKNGSRKFYQDKLKPKNYPLKGYSLGVNYRPTILVAWGDEHFLGFEYEQKNKLRGWREDFICQKKECWIVKNKDLNNSDIQVFEIVYLSLLNALKNKLVLTSNPKEQDLTLVYLSKLSSNADKHPMKLYLKLNWLLTDLKGELIGESRKNKNLYLGLKASLDKHVNILKESLSNQSKLDVYIDGGSVLFDRKYSIDDHALNGRNIFLKSMNLEQYIKRFASLKSYFPVAYMSDDSNYYLFYDPSGDGTQGLRVLVLDKTKEELRPVLNKNKSLAWQLFRQSPIMDEIFQAYMDRFSD